MNVGQYTKDTQLFIKHPNNFSDLSEITNIFIDKATLIHEKDIKIKGLLINKTFYFYENLKKKEFTNVLESEKDKINLDEKSISHNFNDDNSKSEIDKSFTREYPRELAYNTDILLKKQSFISFENPSRKQINPLEKIERLPDKSNSLLSQNSDFTKCLLKQKSKMQTISKINENKNLIDYNHFSDLFSDETKHQRLLEILKMFVLCHFTKTKVSQSTNEKLNVHMNPEDQTIFEFTSMHDVSFESYMVAAKTPIKCFRIKIQGDIQTFPILGINESTENRKRFSIVLHNVAEDNAVLYMRADNPSLLDILDISEKEKNDLKSFLENMKIMGYRYIIYGRKVLDHIQISNYIQKYHIAKTSLTIEQTDLEAFYNEFESKSKLGAVLFIKDKLMPGKF